jgi:hypothetical protein
MVFVATLYLSLSNGSSGFFSFFCLLDLAKIDVNKNKKNWSCCARNYFHKLLVDVVL